jgi:hypothetical protein
MIMIMQMFGEQKEGQKQVNSCLHIIFSIFIIIAIGWQPLRPKHIAYLILKKCEMSHVWRFLYYLLLECHCTTSKLKMNYQWKCWVQWNDLAVCVCVGGGKLRSSFNVVSAFTTDVANRKCYKSTPQKVLTLLHDVLKPSNFSFSGQLCNGFVAFFCDRWLLYKGFWVESIS